MDFVDLDFSKLLNKCVRVSTAMSKYRYVYINLEFFPDYQTVQLGLLNVTRYLLIRDKAHTSSIIGVGIVLRFLANEPPKLIAFIFLKFFLLLQSLRNFCSQPTLTANPDDAYLSKFLDHIHSLRSICIVEQKRANNKRFYYDGGYNIMQVLPFVLGIGTHTKSLV